MATRLYDHSHSLSARSFSAHANLDVNPLEVCLSTGLDDEYLSPLVLFTHQFKLKLRLTAPFEYFNVIGETGEPVPAPPHGRKIKFV